MSTHGLCIAWLRVFLAFAKRWVRQSGDDARTPPDQNQMRRPPSRLCLTLTLLALTACGGSKSSTPPPVVTSLIAVTTASPAVSITQGTSVAAGDISIVRTAFTADVTLSAEGLPDGVTGTFAPAVLSAGATTSTFTLSASPTATTGSKAVTVRARGNGVADATSEVSVTVTAAGPPPSVTLTATPASATLLPGDSASTILNLTRSTGYTGAVTLTVAGAPAGMSTIFSVANPVAASSVRLSLATTAATVPGTYTLLIRANAVGIPEATATYSVVVNPLPSNTVTWTYCDASRIPVFFAYQNGSAGVWRRATESVPGTFTFAVDQPQIGVATVSVEPGTTVTQVAYVALSEIAAVAAAECIDRPVPGTKSVNGTMSGIGTVNEVGSVSIGTGLAGSVTSAAPSFVVSRVPEGPRDVLAVLSDLNAGTTLRMLLSRGVNIANGGTVGTLDMFGSSSFAPATGTLTVSAPNDAALVATNLFTTANGSSATLSISQLSAGTPTTYQGVPEARMLPSDLQQVRVTQNVGTSFLRFVSRYTRGPGSLSLTMPTDVASPTITVIATSPYQRVNISGTLPAAYNGRISFLFDQQFQSRQWSISATALARSASTSYTLVMPDLTAVAGWTNSWALVSGVTPVSSSFSGQTGTAADGSPITGTTLITFSRLGSFTFP